MTTGAEKVTPPRDPLLETTPGDGVARGEVGFGVQTVKLPGAPPGTVPGNGVAIGGAGVGEVAAVEPITV